MTLFIYVQLLKRERHLFFFRMKLAYVVYLQPQNFSTNPNSAIRPTCFHHIVQYLHLCIFGRFFPHLHPCYIWVIYVSTLYLGYIWSLHFSAVERSIAPFALSFGEALPITRTCHQALRTDCIYDWSTLLHLLYCIVFF